jgi:hypothetical protein
VDDYIVSSGRHIRRCKVKRRMKPLQTGRSTRRGQQRLRSLGAGRSDYNT